MCGIFFSCTNHTLADPSDCHYADLKRRGPDSFNTIRRQILGEQLDSGNEACPYISYVNFTATVLSLRGGLIFEQPLEDPHSGSILCWNGEAWKLNGATIVGNDAVAIMNSLVDVVASHISSSTKDRVLEGATTQAVMGVMKSISGPFAFIFFDAQSQMIFYGRDSLGRRSLLQSTSTDGSFSLSSISQSTATDEWTEVEAGCIYRINLGNALPTINDLNSSKQIYDSVQTPQGSPRVATLTRL